MNFKKQKYYNQYTHTVKKYDTLLLVFFTYHNMDIVLASQSQPRKEILEKFGYQFSIVPSEYEEILDPKNTIEDNAIRLAQGKAKDVAEKHPDSLVIGMDTIMADPFGTYLEKPIDVSDAQKMMKNRSGKTETLVSGICMIYKGKEYSAAEISTMTWKKFSQSDWDDIFSTEEWEGKCGGIAIEGTSGKYCSKIEGNFYNIMGFPVNKFWEGMEHYTKSS